MATDSYVEIIDGRPVLKIGSLVSMVAVYLYRAYILGVIQLITTWGSGVTGAVESFGNFLSQDLISNVFIIGGNGLRVALASHGAAVTDIFGVFSPVFIAAEFALILFVLLEYGPAALAKIRGAI